MREVNQGLLDLYQLVIHKSNTHLCDFLEHHHLRQHVKFIKNLAASIINLCKLGSQEVGSLAMYLFGKLTLGDSKN